MQEVTLTDLGGVEIDPVELVTDELIGFVENLNPQLGKEGDPYFNEYTAFINEINSAGLITIDIDQINNAGRRFDDVDLSGTDDTKEIPDAAYFLYVNHVINTMNMATPFDFLAADDEYGPMSELFKPDESFIPLK